ncbi:MAG TPA: hypothetical protein VNK91_02025 [Burkholderiaceae bacterium]|nr:hypothetical protein [Burkholderiaceae bacterium]
MAARFDNTADFLSRATDLPNHNAAYTWMGLVNLTANVAWDCCFSIGTNDTTNTNDGAYVRDNSANIAIYVNGAVGTRAALTFGTATWRWVVARRNSATSIIMRVYDLGAATFAAEASNTTDVSARAAANAMRIGHQVKSNSNDRIDGRMAYSKLWTVALTDAQILREIRRFTPWVRENLYGAWPILTGLRTRDWSGRGRHLTENGTLTDEQGPPVTFRGGGLVVPFVTAAGQTILIGQVTETDLAQPLVRRKTRAIGQVVETDIAQALTARKTRVLGQVTETDIAQALTRRKALTLGQVVETDLAQPVRWAPKNRLIGQVIEIDLAQPITVGGVTAPISEWILRARRRRR